MDSHHIIRFTPAAVSAFGDAPPHFFTEHNWVTRLQVGDTVVFDTLELRVSARQWTVQPSGDATLITFLDVTRQSP